jgi:hypothetical protein
LVTIADHLPREARVIGFVQEHVPPGKKMLSFSGTVWFYWLGHRYPPGRLINTDVKAVWLLRHRPAAILESLNDPDLTLVEFDPANPNLDDMAYRPMAADWVVFRQIQARLDDRFVRRPPVEGLETYVFWVPAAEGRPGS